MHHAGPQNEVAESLRVSPFDLHCLYVQLYVGGQMNVRHAEVFQRFHHVNHGCQYCVLVSRRSVDQWPEQVGGRLMFDHFSRITGLLAIESTPFHWIWNGKSGAGRTGSSATARPSPACDIGWPWYARPPHSSVHWSRVGEQVGVPASFQCSAAGLDQPLQLFYCQASVAAVC